MQNKVDFFSLIPDEIIVMLIEHFVINEDESPLLSFSLVNKKFNHIIKYYPHLATLAPNLNRLYQHNKLMSDLKEKIANKKNTTNLIFLQRELKDYQNIFSQSQNIWSKSFKISRLINDIKEMPQADYFDPRKFLKYCTSPLIVGGTAGIIFLSYFIVCLYYLIDAINRVNLAKTQLAANHMTPQDCDKSWEGPCKGYNSGVDDQNTFGAQLGIDSFAIALILFCFVMGLRNHIIHLSKELPYQNLPINFLKKEHKLSLDKFIANYPEDFKNMKADTIEKLVTFMENLIAGPRKKEHALLAEYDQFVERVKLELAATNCNDSANASTTFFFTQPNKLNQKENTSHAQDHTVVDMLSENEEASDDDEIPLLSKQEQSGYKTLIV